MAHFTTRPEKLWISKAGARADSYAKEMTTENLLEQPTLDEICHRLRELRKGRNLTLSDVERLSKGEIKSVILGAYERGARSISVKKIVAIAALYEVPVNEIISGNLRDGSIVGQKSTIDLRKVLATADMDKRHELLAKYLRSIAHLRGDWNGQIISIRHSDLVAISLLCDCAPNFVRDWLRDEGLLIK